ncbi:Stomatal closure-related actin-binding protein 1 [Sesamum angolense]|uniref:Stomatal closure-related actin-binding protein 1 n=1 Tax=Sesamum angolense TaxID=2727404 RepID=A0AAE1X8Y7_9LAMI|nr:Stomatal closure-related actin-binding protein 1 [Sesamum angolense]
MVARETALLLEQQKRLSVRDLASKFEKGLAAAAKLSDEVEALAVQLTQREGELIQEKAEVKKLATFLKQASEDAKKLVDEERAFARAEIENARAAVQRVEEALQEHEQMSRASGKQDVDELMKEVQEARRIKMLHQPSRVVTLVMDMEHELQALRIQLAEKSKHSLQLQKEVLLLFCIYLIPFIYVYFSMFYSSYGMFAYWLSELALSKKGDKDAPHLYDIDGTLALGSYLLIYPCSDSAPELSECAFQWYRSTAEGGKKEPISGATKSVYAPEPFDVGRILHADILIADHTITLTTSAPIDPAPGLGNYVEALVRRHETEFNVVIIQMNGVDHPSQSIHVLHIGKMRIKLCKGKTTMAKEYYSNSMQAAVRSHSGKIEKAQNYSELCGVRGGGNAAAQAVYWQAKVGLSFVLAFESERERNAAIMLARRFAFDCNITLGGPDDRSSSGS